MSNPDLSSEAWMTLRTLMTLPGRVLRVPHSDPARRELLAKGMALEAGDDCIQPTPAGAGEFVRRSVVSYGMG